MDLRPDDALPDEISWAIVDAAPDGIMLADEAGAIIVANRQAESLFGYDDGALIGRSVDELLPERFRHVHRAHRAKYGAEPRTRAMGVGQILYGLRRDGTEFPVEVSLSPTEIGSSLRIIAAVRDVSARLADEERLRDAEQMLRIVEDRDRIARDLHDVVIQRLFAAGLAVQGVQTRTRDRAASERLAGVVDELDETIREIRSVIFSLQSAGIGRASSLRSEITRVIAEEKDVLGFEPRVRLEGVIDTAPDAVGAQLLPTLREALSNIGRHAGAASALVRVTADDRMTLRVEDDGVGISGDPVFGDGIRNMRQRAIELGGSCEVEPSVDGGTVLEWSVPMQDEGP